MSSSPIYQLFIILIICFVLSAFFSSSETALTSINKIKLRGAVKNKIPGAAKTEAITKRIDLLLILLLICNNVVNVLAASLATIIGLRLYGEIGVALATGLLTLLLLFFAEIIPKTIATLHSDKLSFKVSGTIYLLLFIFKPLIHLVNYLTRFFIKILGVTGSNNEAISNEELKILVNESLSKSDNSKMMSSILDLEKVDVADVMTPASEIYSIDVNDDYKSILKMLLNSPHSSIVAYRESFDNIVGILRAKEAYKNLIESENPSKEILLRAIDEPTYIPETTSLAKQLVHYKNSKEKVCLVLDEYGELMGLISIDDILKEIVGDFNHQDYFEYELNKQGGIIIDGSTLVRDLVKQFNWDLDTNKSRTLNGYILEITKDFPTKGTVIETDRLQFKIIDTSHTMITQVEISIKK